MRWGGWGRAGELSGGDHAGAEHGAVGDVPHGLHDLVEAVAALGHRLEVELPLLGEPHHPGQVAAHPQRALLAAVHRLAVVGELHHGERDGGAGVLAQPGRRQVPGRAGHGPCLLDGPGLARRLEDEVGAAPLVDAPEVPREVHDGLDRVDLGGVEGRGGAEAQGGLAPVGQRVDRDDLRGQGQPRRLHVGQPDWPAAHHGDDAAGLCSVMYAHTALHLPVLCWSGPVRSPLSRRARPGSPGGG